MRVALFALFALAVGTTRAAAQPAVDDSNPIRERFVAFARDWMPIVRVGYLVQVERFELGDLRRREVSHGLTSDVLVPFLATGSRDTPVRLALVLGAGIDFTGRDYPPVRPPDEFEEPTPSVPDERRAVVGYGQFGVLLRTTRGDLGFVGSLVWQPSRWYLVDQLSQGVIGRGRLALGLTVGPWEVGAFVGLNGIEALVRVVDVGLHVGAGW